MIEQDKDHHKFEIVNGIEIDKGIVSLVKEFWRKHIRTYECCQGGEVYVDEFDYESVKDFYKENDEFGYYVKSNRIYEKAFIIMHKNDLKRALKILKRQKIIYNIISGTNGFCPSEYNKNCPDYNQMLFMTLELY